MTDPSRPTVEPLNRQDERTLIEKGRRAVIKNTKKLETLIVEYVSPGKIFPNAYNPNRQSEREFELLCSSMKEDGFTQPILVHRASKEIVDGEHRWRAAQFLGLPEVPVVFVDMTPEQMRVSTLRHNRARGSEDIELTISLLKDLRELGALDHAVDSLGMSDKEINALLDDLPAPDVQASVEFSDSWVPSPAQLSENHINSRGQIESATQGAMNKKNRVESVIAGANNEEQYQVLAQQHKWLSVVVQFNTEQTMIVLPVIESSPAEIILQLCIFHLKLKSIPLFVYKP